MLRIGIRVVLLVFAYNFLLTACEKEGVAPSEFLDYETIADLEIPFKQEWFVVWGGRTLGENYHASLADQRFAFDVVQLENNKTHVGDGGQNEDYYCFGDTLYSPGAGRVVEMQTSVLDNIPGETNKDQLFGNYVIIDHGNQEYSVLAHFKLNSIFVKVGAVVTKGQVLGLTGNSGNSTEPHLHYHLQNHPGISQGAGLPAQFKDYYANDVFIPIGEPLRNQTIRKD